MKRVSLLIRNALVALPEGLAVTSVAVDEGLIVDVEPGAGVLAEQEIDASGLCLLPGIIDDQVHFREPGLTHKEDLAHASRACAAGGITSFLEMPNTVPATISRDRLHEKLELASRSSLVNYGFYMGATCQNLEELKAATRTPGIKIFMGSSTGDLLVDDQSALERIFAETTLPICAHCEDESTVRANAEQYRDRADVAVHSLIRDHAAARIATARAIDLANRHQHRFHVLHVSTADEIPLIRNAGPLVTAEVCPHHLLFTVDDYQRLGTLVKMNPSIKTRADQAALWQALSDGVITVIATDHAPHTLEEKHLPAMKAPAGLPAVENSLALMLNEVSRGRVELPQVVRWMSSEPARIWNLKGKGRIAAGFDADLVLIDLACERTVRNSEQLTKCRWSPWDGAVLTGWPVRTWVHGQEVFRRVDDRNQFADHSPGREIQFDRTQSERRV